MTPRGKHLLLGGFSVVGYLLCARLLLEHGILGYGGEGAGDVFAYWTAGGHLLAGEPVYGAGVGGYAAFLYPPPLAQVFAPLSLLPFPIVVWLWRAVILIALRIAVGSWRNAGLAMLLWPPVISEIDAGNVHLLIAAATAEAIRGRAQGIGPVALTKFATVAAVPMAMRTGPRGLLIGGAIAAITLVFSFLAAPDLWVSYVQFALSGPPPNPGWYNLGDQIPGWLRFGTAAAMALAAMRWARLAGVAVTLALPVLWVHGLSTLVAVVAGPAQRHGHSPGGANATA